MAEDIIRLVAWDSIFKSRSYGTNGQVCPRIHAGARKHDLADCIQPLYEVFRPSQLSKSPFAALNYANCHVIVQTMLMNAIHFCIKCRMLQVTLFACFRRVALPRQSGFEKKICPSKLVPSRLPISSKGYPSKRVKQKTFSAC